MGKLVLPKIISDGMVIQRRKRIHIWGWDEPGRGIEVRLDNLMSTGRADERGRFDIYLSAKESGGPYELIVSDDKDEEIAVKDVMIGIVWLATGQSNMELPIARVKDRYPALAQIEENPAVRAWGTEWAIKNNGFDPAEYPDPKAKVRNATDTANITLGEKRLYVFQSKYGSCSPYWGRSPSTTDKKQAVCTKDGGQVGRIEVGRDNEGVRPALYLAEGSYRIISGSGTLEDPYEIAPAGTEE